MPSDSKELTVTNKTHDFLVFIGRFQPYHNGHARVVEQALESASHLIILIGSAHRPHCIRNPWSFKERERMIRSTLTDADNERVHIAPVMDATYNEDAWLANVQKSVNGIVTAHHTQPHRDAKIGLIGHAKDHSSYYLKLFPTWSSVDVSETEPMSATDVREAIFRSDVGAWEDFRTSVESNAGELVPPQVLDFLNQYTRGEAFKALRDEFDFLADYRDRWSDAPYAPTFLTVDAVVVQSGHILLVERRARPGKGQMALPGGFVGQNETLRESMLRELKEETNIKVPVPVLAGSIEAEGVFDDPYRSTRGRTVTHAFYIHLKPDTSLPKVRGGDDARRAFWLPLADLNPENMYEDHYFIIQKMVGQSS
ncbi:MAG: bifunctional nicotinamide-nucleotide adenylyltransferase/Nudix hydroxylase [Woeseiaceae bacterium]|nr:bifunctional nicotinamide-nucleotide adenylyltransferase/Nudix hydroxylase [Woeseiaceae bacterium]